MRPLIVSNGWYGELASIKSHPATLSSGMTDTLVFLRLCVEHQFGSTIIKFKWKDMP